LVGGGGGVRCCWWVVVWRNANGGYAEAAGGIYTYYRACMFSLFLLLRSGGHCEWFCVSTGLSTGCG